MAPAFRHDAILRSFAWSLSVLAVVTVAALGHFYLLLPSVAMSTISGAPPVAWPTVASHGDIAWSALRTSESAPATDAGELSRKLRLAGTFFAFEGAEQSRKAIIDNLEDKQQYIVGENETVGPAQVVTIFEDHVLLSSGGKEETIWLRFTGDGRGKAATAGASAAGVAARISAGEVTRFGKRLQENRWLFSRDKLLAYYQELLDDPDRLVHVFDSLKPLYNKERKITGYVLGVEGEGEFFKGVGLQQGDVVRKVNSLEMSNRSRAEYFINEFVKNRVNAFVLDVERNGVPQKLIYEVH